MSFQVLPLPARLSSNAKIPTIISKPSIQIPSFLGSIPTKFLSSNPSSVQDKTLILTTTQKPPSDLEDFSSSILLAALNQNQSFATKRNLSSSLLLSKLHSCLFNCFSIEGSRNATITFSFNPTFIISSPEKPALEFQKFSPPPDSSPLAQNSSQTVDESNESKQNEKVENDEKVTAAIFPQSIKPDIDFNNSAELTLKQPNTDHIWTSENSNETIVTDVAISKDEGISEKDIKDEPISLENDFKDETIFNDGSTLEGNLKEDILKGFARFESD